VSEGSKVANSFDLFCQTITQIQTQMRNPRSDQVLKSADFIHFS
jgi:hypothetical protein